MSKLESILIGVIVLILAIVGFAFYFEHRGATECKQANVVAADRQETHEAVKAATDAKTINTEAQTYANTVAVAPDPTPALICVRRYTAPQALSATPAAQPLSHGAPDHPAADRPPVTDDPGPDLGKIGQAADAQITELQDYIRNVCLVK